MTENEHDDVQQNVVEKNETESKFWSSLSRLPIYLPPGS